MEGLGLGFESALSASRREFALVPKRANVTGEGEAGACAKPPTWRCGTPLVLRKAFELRTGFMSERTRLFGCCTGTELHRRLGAWTYSVLRSSASMQWCTGRRRTGQLAPTLPVLLTVRLGSPTASGRAARANGNGLEFKAPFR